MDVNTQYDTFEAAAASDRQADSGGAGEKKESWLDFALFVAKLVLAVLVFRSFVFSPFSIPSESMLPRLYNGDYLLAAKWPYGFSNNSLPFDLGLPAGRILTGAPERGDIVIFKHPVDGTDYIKRVIGLPGDSVAVVGGAVVLNGEQLARRRIGDFDLPLSPNTGCAWGATEAAAADGTPVCRYPRFRETLPGGRSYDVLDFRNTKADDFAPVTVPAGRIFVMGDNRDNSQDSRFPAMVGGGVGMVPQANLVGEATVLMWSTDGSAQWIRPWTWFSAARWGRIGDRL